MSSATILTNVTRVIEEFASKKRKYVSNAWIVINVFITLIISVLIIIVDPVTPTVNVQITTNVIHSRMNVFNASLIATV